MSLASAARRFRRPVLAAFLLAAFLLATSGATGPAEAQYYPYYGYAPYYSGYCDPYYNPYACAGYGYGSGYGYGYGYPYAYGYPYYGLAALGFGFGFGNHFHHGFRGGFHGGGFRGGSFRGGGFGGGFHRR